MTVPVMGANLFSLIDNSREQAVFEHSVKSTAARSRWWSEASVILGVGPKESQPVKLYFDVFQTICAQGSPAELQAASLAGISS